MRLVAAVEAGHRVGQVPKVRTEPAALVSRGTWRDLYPFVLVFTGPLLLLGLPLAKGEVLYWGTPLLQFVPWREFALETLTRGHLPLWNPLVGMGAPLLANYQSALLYPPNLLLALVGPAWGHGLLVLLHLAWAGAGMVVLARRLGLSALAQAVAGVAFGLSGYLVARAGFLSINAAAAWLPWIIVAVERSGGVAAKDRAQWRQAVVLLAVPLALQWLAGHAQTSWYTLLLALGWATWRGAQGGRLKSLLRSYAAFVLGAALAFLLSSAQLLPTIEFLLNSQRSSSVDPEVGMTYSLWPWRLLGWLFPDFFGNPARGDFWGYGNYWEDAIYVGVLPLVLASSCVLRGLLRKDPDNGLVRFLLVVSLAAMVLALGRNTPIYPFLFEHVPTFSMFQAPARWSLLTTFSLSLLAGLGVRAWAPLRGRGLYWTRLGTAGAAILGLAAWAAWNLISGLELSMVRALALGGIWLSATGVLALTRRQEAGRLWRSSVLLICLLDLAIAGWGLNPFTHPDLYEGDTSLAAKVDDGHRTYMRSRLEYELKFNRFFRFDAFGHSADWIQVRESGLPNATMLDRIPTANNFDPLVPERYALWMESLEELPQYRRRPLFELMDVGWQGLADLAAPAGVEYVAMAGSARIHLPSKVTWVGSKEEALEVILAPGFDPDEVVVLEGSPVADGERTGIEAEAFVLEDDNPNRVRLQVRSDGALWVVLSDVYYPGWRAAMDGEPAKIYPADFLFQAIRVPAGIHELEFVYSPDSFWVGWMLSLVGLLLIGALRLRWRHD